MFDYIYLDVEFEVIKDEPEVGDFKDNPGDDEKVRCENTELMIDIARLCNRKDRSKVENIFLLGRSGAGKSALVNTLIKVIAGQYIPKAKVGAGVTQSKTLTLER